MSRSSSALSKPYKNDKTDLPSRYDVYNILKAVSVDPSVKITMETRRQADGLFETYLQRSAVLGKYKTEEKKRFFRSLMHATKQALYHDGCVQISRDYTKTSRVNIKVIDAAVSQKLFWEVRSPPGAKKMSRLIPLPRLAKTASEDPWEFDENHMKQFVFLRERGEERDELWFDPSESVPEEFQRKLETINEVNSKFSITYRKYDVKQERLTKYKKLRPVHYAIFTDTFERHGRIYTGTYGHQSLRGLERQTILFNGEPCVEWDYSGLHTRMLYHMEGIDYRGDPYRFWGVETKPQMRMMAKVMVNAAINASTRQAAISACNFAMSAFSKTTGKDGTRVYKTGKEMEEATSLLRAYRETGLKFDAIYDLAIRMHKPVAKYFGSDKGMELMNKDGKIALGVLYYFAEKGIPCLGCHDSFLVPTSYSLELRKMMRKTYNGYFSFLPVVKTH